jgi:trk system potassium uptake protein TrkH
MLIEQTHGILPGLNPGAMIGRIFAYTFTFELLGAVILTWRFLDSNPPGRAIWLGVFHSVSAFCNAGFSLFTDSLVGRQADLWVNFVVMGLIIAGGLGTIVLADLHHYATILIHGRERRPRLIFHTRVVLWTTGGLILLGALLVVLFETHSSSMPDTFGGRLLAGLFLSVTSRTAGFNTIDTGALTNATLLTLVFFMMVGGSPGSTAGGIKTSTMAALIAHFRGQASSNPKPHLLHRRVSPEIAGKALATLFGFLTVAMTALVLLQWTEMGSMGPTAQRAAFLPHLFEVVSALCTVGLSTGVTSELSETGRGVIIACMFLGRLGPILVASSLIAVRRRDNFSYPEGNLYIG